MNSIVQLCKKVKPGGEKTSSNYICLLDQKKSKSLRKSENTVSVFGESFSKKRTCSFRNNPEHTININFCLIWSVKFLACYFRGLIIFSNFFDFFKASSCNLRFSRLAHHLQIHQFPMRFLDDKRFTARFSSSGQAFRAHMLRIGLHPSTVTACV